MLIALPIRMTFSYSEEDQDNVIKSGCKGVSSGLKGTCLFAKVIIVIGLRLVPQAMKFDPKTKTNLSSLIFVMFHPV